MSREDCENRERCGATGHYFTGAGYVRCPCLQLELNRRQLGSMYCPDPLEKTQLEAVKKKDLVIEGPLATIRKHVARILLDMAARHESYITMDAYRLIEIFLKQDEEHENLYATVEADLLIILLGFGDPRNRYLPELVLQALSRREITYKPTWMILGMEKKQVAGRYSQELAEKIDLMQRVVIR
jgi:hypothetical protein